MEEEVYGFVEHIVYQSEETGFAVARLQEPRKKELTTLTGVMPGLRCGETVRCIGKWCHHPKHGTQFDVKQMETRQPEDLVGIEKYLGSGLVKGIGPVYAARIVQQFGLDTLHIIDTDPERLHEIDGLGKKRIAKIRSCWEEQRSIRELMVFLKSYELGPSLAQKIYRCYGDEALNTVKEDPYKLCRDIWGIGFKTSDNLALKMGMSKECAPRILAGIEHVLSTLTEDGHVCFPLFEFIERASALLEVDSPAVEEHIEALEKEQRIVCQDLGEVGTCIWLKSLHVAETGIARELKRLLGAPCFLRAIEQDKALDWAEQQLNLSFAANQKQAIALAMQDKVCIITGGPGTGKSTITNAILRISGKLTQRILLAAPTGRAAKRMNEITGFPASTIHSLLEFDFKTMGFKRKKDNPLECDLLIVDEASMIDTHLMYSLLKAIPKSARAIFVGDINQLPSVGAGNVLRDIIDSERVPVCRLTEIFRQARGSKIIVNSHRINAGEFPFLKPKRQDDFFWINAEEKEDVLKEIVSLAKQRLPKAYGFNPINDIQILAPMKKGEIGTQNLNHILQEQLNPCTTPFFHGGKRLHPGDKVMQIRNNYQKEVYNGDIGLIQRVDPVEQVVIVNVDGRLLYYDFSELDELVLAYAVSVHKYQGSECPCVIMPVHTSHFKLLHRNLLYTGVTRGKKLVVLVGMKKALAICVKNDEVEQRYTGLVDHLEKILK